MADAEARLIFIQSEIDANRANYATKAELKAYIDGIKDQLNSIQADIRAQPVR